jgi:hypothetical protein
MTVRRAESSGLHPTTWEERRARITRQIKEERAREDFSEFSKSRSPSESTFLETLGEERLDRAAESARLISEDIQREPPVSGEEG